MRIAAGKVVVVVGTAAKIEEVNFEPCFEDGELTGICCPNCGWN